MAWFTPITWTLGQLVGASDLNEQIRDNMNIHHTEIGDDGTIGALGLSQYRLSLTTAVPVTTADVAAASTLYWTPLTGIGDRVRIHDGSGKWLVVAPGELSITNAGLAQDTVYDVFVDYNGGTEQLVLVAWTDDTTRATGLATQNGIYVRSGNTDHLYVGTVRTDGSSPPTFNDTAAVRHVWNMYNRKRRALRYKVATDTWSAGTADVWRAFQGLTTDFLDVLNGLDEDIIEVQVMLSGTGSGVIYSAAVGLDSTTAPHADGFPCITRTGSANQVIGHWRGHAGVGRHQLWALEHDGDGTSAPTFQGDGGGDEEQSGLIGTMVA